jgi:hypothetical protein
MRIDFTTNSNVNETRNARCCCEVIAAAAAADDDDEMRSGAVRLSPVCHSSSMPELGEESIGRCEFVFQTRERGLTTTTTTYPLDNWSNRT